MMDSRALNYFLAVAKEGNMTKAAKKLHMTQPPLSRQIAQLEAELGTKLFEREKGQMTLTDAGKVLQKRGLEIQHSIYLAEQDVLDVRNGKMGRIFIGAIASVGMNYIVDWISSFLRIYPNIRYSVWEGVSDDILRRIDIGELDIGFVRGNMNSQIYEKTEICREPLVAVILKTSKYGNSTENINLSDILNCRLVVPVGIEKMVKELFMAHDGVANIVCTCSSLVYGIAWVEQGLGIGIFPNSYNTRRYFKFETNK